MPTYIFLPLQLIIQILPFFLCFHLAFSAHERSTRQYVLASMLMYGFIIMLSTSFLYSYLGRTMTSILIYSLHVVLIFCLTDFSLWQSFYCVLFWANILDCLKLLIRVFYDANDHLYSGYASYTIWLTLGCLLVGLPICYWFLKKVLSPLLEKTKDLSIWNYIFLLPLTFYILFRVGVFPDYFGQSRTFLLPTYLLPFFWGITIYVLHYCLIRGLTILSNTRQMENTLRYTEVLRSIQDNQYQNIQDTVEHARKVRHDFRHSILLLKSYADMEDYDKILAFTDEYADTIYTVETQQYCSFLSINSLLFYYVQQGQALGIQAQIQVSLPDQLPCQETDLCIVLLNLVNNTLKSFSANSQKENGRVHVEIKSAENQVLSISISNNSGHPMSEQSLLPIQNMIEKYHGVIESSSHQEFWTVKVLLFA